MARRYAHKIPFIVKLNHNEFLTYPNTYDQVMFGSRGRRPSTWAPSASAPPSTSAPNESDRQIQEVSEAFAEAHRLGMFTVLWCYLRNTAFKTKEADYHAVGRPHRPGQPPRRHHRGRHHQAEAAREQRRLQRPRASARPTRSSTSELTTDHPIDLTRWQVVNCYMGRVGADQLRRRVQGRERPRRGRAHRGHQQARRRHGLIMGRKAFQRPMAEGVELLHAVQDVYLDPSVTIA